MPSASSPQLINYCLFKFFLKAKMVHQIAIDKMEKVPPRDSSEPPKGK